MLQPHPPTPPPQKKKEKKEEKMTVHLHDVHINLLPISAISELLQEVHEENKCRLRITFFNESSGDETQWLVTMESVAGVMAMIEAVRGPWEEAFGVEMDVEVSAFELSL